VQSAKRPCCFRANLLLLGDERQQKWVDPFSSFLARTRAWSRNKIHRHWQGEDKDKEDTFFSKKTWLDRCTETSGSQPTARKGRRVTFSSNVSMRRVYRGPLMMDPGWTPRRRATFSRSGHSDISRPKRATSFRTLATLVDHPITARFCFTCLLRLSKRS